MSGPSKEIPASHLWLKLQEMPRPSKLVDFPRRGEDGEPIGQTAIRILTQEEQMACAMAAEKSAREHLKDAKRDEIGYERFFSDAHCVEVLYRACRDPDDVTRTAFPSSKLLREALTTEECAALFTHYLTIQLELGPTVSNMGDEEIEAWIDRLVEGGSAFPFDLVSSDLQKILLLHMAYQLRSSQTDTSSVGSPPEETIPSDNDSLSS